MFRGILEQLPSLLTMLVCLLLAAFRWKRHPKVSLVLIVSLILLIVHTLSFLAIYYWAPEAVMQSGWISMQTMLTALGFIYNAALAVPFALLLIAIFMQRKAPAQTS